ncbi:MAG: DUF3781 domain-containing protein, partial [Fibrobacterota bacterium]
IHTDRIIDNICYTERVYGRIQKKLNIKSSKEEIETLILNVLKNTAPENYSQTGKNYYITNSDTKIRVTINSFTHRVITVDTLKKAAL